MILFAKTAYFMSFLKLKAVDYEDLRPKFMLTCWCHLTSAFRTGLQVPLFNSVRSTSQAESAHDGIEARGGIPDDTTYHKRNDSLAVWA